MGKLVKVKELELELVRVKALEDIFKSIYSVNLDNELIGHVLSVYRPRANSVYKWAYSLGKDYELISLAKYCTRLLALERLVDRHKNRKVT